MKHVDTKPIRPNPLSQVRAEHIMISTGDYAGTIASQSTTNGLYPSCPASSWPISN